MICFEAFTASGTEDLRRQVRLWLKDMNDMDGLPIITIQQVNLIPTSVANIFILTVFFTT
jgi:hypothetical protein